MSVSKHTNTKRQAPNTQITPDAWNLKPETWRPSTFKPSGYAFSYPELPEQTNFYQPSYAFDIHPFLGRPISPYSATILISSPSWTDRFHPTQLRFWYPAFPEQTSFPQPFFHTQRFLTRPILSNPATIFILSPSWTDRFPQSFFQTPHRGF